MEKQELEKLFNDCDHLKELCEQMRRCRPCRSGSSSDKPKARLARAPRDAEAPEPSLDDIRYNRGFLVVKPSAKGAILIEMAINRIGISGRTDRQIDGLVEGEAPGREAEAEGQGPPALTFK